MVPGMDGVHQQAWCCVHIVDHHGELPIVPEITHSQTTRRRRPIDTGTSIRRNISKSPVSVVVIEETLLLIGTPQVILVHFRIDMAIREYKVRPAVVVKVKKHCAPT